MINNVVWVSQYEPLAEFESLFTGEGWKKNDGNKRLRSSSLRRGERALWTPWTLAPRHMDGVMDGVDFASGGREAALNRDLTERLTLSAN